LALDYLVVVKPMMTCPSCGKEYEDFDGFGVLYCFDCNYCTHGSVTDGICGFCGERIEFVKLADGCHEARVVR
jgi:hypothetical protein